MSGKNRTSPEKIGPLVHPDMSGKYQTSPDLLMSCNKNSSHLPRHHKNCGLFLERGGILLILHKSFTGPTPLLSANVRGPLSFTVSASHRIKIASCQNLTVVAKNVGHVGHCRRQDPNVRWVLCKHQTICPTAQAKTWLLKCLQSRKNCQCTSSILLNEVCYFPLWVTGVLYEKNDPNHVLIDGRKWGLLAVMVTNATLALFKSVPTRATICHSCQ